MKIRGLIVAAAVFFVLGGTLYWSDHHKAAEDTTKTSPDTPPILKLDEAAITKLELKKKDAPPIVLIKASDNWQIAEPKELRADQSAVLGMVSTLSSLNSERLVEEKASDLKRYGLDQPAFEADITEKDSKTQKLLIGDDTPTGSAAYAMLAGTPRIYTMASFNKSSVDKGLNDLRDKRLLTASFDRISRIELVKKGQDIEFGRSKDGWQILKPKPLRADSSQVDEIARKLTDARMDLPGGSESGDASTAFAKATPLVTARVTDQSGIQELQIRKSKDTYYAQSSAVAGIYKVGPDLGTGLDKALDDFRNKKIFDFGFDDPDKVELHNGSKAYFLTRSGADWWSDGKKMDSESVQSFLAKLRELTADKFPDAGFAKPAIVAIVTSGNGQRLERVSIAKSGNGYIARREGEPALYELSSGPVEDALKAADGIVAAAKAK